MKIAVIGGGPAGMMAAYAASAYADVTLFDRNEKLGKKLFLTGKGRCNITNARPKEDFFENIPKNSRFLYSAFNSFDNDDIVKLLNDNGLATKVERGNRIFPESDKSSDVIRTFERILKASNVKISLNSKIDDLIIEDGVCTGILVNGKKLRFDRVIVATGGCSYRSTGSDGAFFNILREYGHTVTEIHPSLIPFNAKDKLLCSSLMGVSLKNVRVSFYEKNKLRFSDVGEMLFTHFGLSGPLVLSASAHVTDYHFVDSKLVIDLKPGLDYEKLDKRILRDIEENPGVEVKSILRMLMPKALVDVIPGIAGVNENQKVSVLSKKDRQSLINVIKNFTFTITSLREINEAIVTRGGINIKEINSSSMESKIIGNLYFAGEMIDVDAYTGGYNLQIAYSTGYLAGISAGTSF